MSSAIASALAHALFHFLWQGALIALVLAAAIHGVRPSSARTRYGLACLAMLAMLAAFGVTLARFWPHSPAVITSATASPAVPPPFFAYYELPATTGPASRPLNWVARLWMLGVVVFSLRSLVAWLAAMRMRRVGVGAAPATWEASLARLAERVRVATSVKLLASHLTDIPVVMGLLKPVILVPASLFAGFPPGHLEMILLHELAHIRRHDYLVNLLQNLAEDLLFYHPAVWWVSAVIRAERENCCDDMVVAAQGDAHGFAEALAALEERRWSVHDAALAANGGDLMNRIRRLLDARHRPARFVAAPAFSASLLVAVVTLAVSAGHAQQAPATPAAAPSATPAPAPRPQPAPAPAPVAADTPYQQWLNEEVVYIITPEERQAFRALTTDEDRERFIEQFWLKRDPTPGTPENEYREEHYRRIAYADETFATNAVPGWKTDRGRIYIKYGPPVEREAHPGRGFDGTRGPGKQAVEFPSEKWRYRYIEGMGSNVVIDFVDTTGTGEFHMTSDPAEKDKGLYVPRASREPGVRAYPASEEQFRRFEAFAQLQAPSKPVVAPADAIENIVFTGARRTPRDLLLNLIPTRSGDKLDQDFLDRDVKLLRNTERFDDVTVRYARGKTGWIVTFNVVERPVQRLKKRGAERSLAPAAST